MKPARKIFAMCIVFVGLSPMAQAGDLTCQAGAQRLSIKQTAAGTFTISLVNDLIVAQFRNAETLHRAYPGISEELVQKLLSGAQQPGFGNDLKDCAEMSACEFAAPGSGQLVQCTGGDQATYRRTLKIELDRQRLVYRMTCTTEGMLESSEQGLELNKQGWKSKMPQQTFAPASCIYQ